MSSGWPTVSRTAPARSGSSQTT